ncbi:MAG: hypothetical protein Q4D48_04780 [Coriobacteriales bacterium]|nr:hypothetical protein [Coriobacteriales bacterium]
MATDTVDMQAEETNEATSTSISPEVMNALFETLSGANRRRRQEASHAIALAAAEDANLVRPYVDELIDALYRPEAQTRWEVLSALSDLALIDADLVEEGYDGAEASLFDEDSAIVRLAAFRFLIRLGASSPERSDKVWGIVDEAIQCYHGDPEYRDMLIAISEFSRGSISKATHDALMTRIGFDAQNGRGYVRIMSSEIVSAAKGA